MKHQSIPTKSIQTGLDLERRILQGLRLEWESVMGFVTHPSRPLMAPPLFSLKDGKKNLAQWNPASREISFSRTFVLNHPWDALKEVLVHEMAHQYASEVLHASGETPHGPSFKKACQVLKANPKASGSYAPLTERLVAGDLSENDRILIKVRKLLALGNSLNKNEAESAVAKAHALIEKYNLDMLEKDDERHFVSVFVGDPALTHGRHDYLLGHLLAEHYYVYGIWVPAYVLSKGKMGRVFEITGTLENVNIASYVHDFIMNHARKAWEDFSRGSKMGRSRKSDFYTGLVLGFQDRLKKEQAARSTAPAPNPRSRSLVALDPKLTEYTDFKYPRVRHHKRPPRPVDNTALNAGKNIGKKLVLAKAVETASERSIGLLTDGR